MQQWNAVLDEPADFSLVQDGPHFQMLPRAGLVRAGDREVLRRSLTRRLEHLHSASERQALSDTSYLPGGSGRYRSASRHRRRNAEPERR
jgi:hypothetical protein